MTGHQDREPRDRGHKAPEVPPAKPNGLADLVAQMGGTLPPGAKIVPRRQRVPKIRVVPSEHGACPRCGAYWGHPNKELDWPNRSKVGDEHGVWWWKCYNPNCTCGYYDPDTGRSDDRPTPEEEARSREEARQWVKQITRGKKWVSREVAPGITESHLEDDPDYDENKEQR